MLRSGAACRALVPKTKYPCLAPVPALLPVLPIPSGRVGQGRAGPGRARGGAGRGGAGPGRAGQGRAGKFCKGEGSKAGPGQGQNGKFATLGGKGRGGRATGQGQGRGMDIPLWNQCEASSPRPHHLRKPARETPRRCRNARSCRMALTSAHCHCKQPVNKAKIQDNYMVRGPLLSGQADTHLVLRQQS